MSELGVVKAVVKPALQRPYVPERRFLLQGKLWDDQGGERPRFYSCLEVKPSHTSAHAKQFLLLRTRQKDGRSWQRDLHMLSQLRHPYILGYKDAWESRGLQYVLCEDARMFLSVCLRQMAASKDPAPSRELYPKWLFHIISALEYIHEKNNEDQPVMHRAVQPDNILITHRGVLQLCAFHTSKRLEAKQAKTGTVLGGGHLFQSPESTEGTPYDQSVDIWSFGVTGAYIVNYTRATKAASVETLLKLVEESGQDTEALVVVQSALTKQPDRRPRASWISQYLSGHYGEGWLNAAPDPHCFPSALVKEISQYSPQGHIPGEHDKTGHRQAPTTHRMQDSLAQTTPQPKRNLMKDHLASSSSSPTSLARFSDPSSPGPSHLQTTPRPEPCSRHSMTADHPHRTSSTMSLTPPFNSSRDPEIEDTCTSFDSDSETSSVISQTSMEGTHLDDPEVLRKIAQIIQKRIKNEDHPQFRIQRRKSSQSTHGDDFNLDRGDGHLAEGGQGQGVSGQRVRSHRDTTIGVTGSATELCDDDLSGGEILSRGSSQRRSKYPSPAKDLPQHHGSRKTSYHPPSSPHYLQLGASRHPTPRPHYCDLSVDTDGTSGLGDSCNSQDLADFC